jgi:hypothetical protein
MDGAFGVSLLRPFGCKVRGPEQIARRKATADALFTPVARPSLRNEVIASQA